MNSPSVAILGPGAVGGFLAAVLWRHGVAVTCVTREPSAELIARQGIRLESETFGELTARAAAVTRLNDEPDLLFVCTKMTGLAEALKRVDAKQLRRTLVVPLLNGIEHMQVLRSACCTRVIAASIGSFEAIRKAPNHIVHRSASARIELAFEGDTERRKLSDLIRLLCGAGIMTALLPNEAAVLWGKLGRLHAIALFTALANQPLGIVRADPAWRSQMEACVHEAAAVANAEGAALNPVQIMKQIDALPAGLETSMQRDIAAGRPSELDAIAGAVVRAGERHGLRCPTIQGVIEALHGQNVGSFVHG